MKSYKIKNSIRLKINGSCFVIGYDVERVMDEEKLQGIFIEKIPRNGLGKISHQKLIALFKI